MSTRRALALLALLVATPALGDVGADAKVRAKALYESAKVHYDLAEWQAAIDDYKEAYRVDHLPEFLFDIGQCYRMLKQRDDAITAYHAYLREAPGTPTKAEAQKIIESYEKESPPAPTSAPATSAAASAPRPPAPQALPGHVRAIGLALNALPGGRRVVRVTLHDVHLPHLKGAHIRVRATVAQGTVEFQAPAQPVKVVESDDVTWPQVSYDLDAAVVAEHVDPALPSRLIVHVVAISADTHEAQDVARAGMGFTLARMRPAPVKR